MRLMDCPEIQRGADLKTRRLTVTFTWREQDDLAILSQLGKDTESDTPKESELPESPEDEPVDLSEDQNGRAAELLQAVGLTRRLDESTWRQQFMPITGRERYASMAPLWWTTSR
jgi:hypothetical protein